MDPYWSYIFDSVPDDNYICKDEAYTVYEIVRDPATDGVTIDGKSISKPNLRGWAQEPTLTTDGSNPLAAFKCLIVTTHDFNDYPVDISREDLSFVASRFGISPAHTTLLFAPYTGYASLDLKMCWSYGRPGLRAVTCTEATGCLTRAIVIVAGSTKQSLEDHLRMFADFVDHPFMLAQIVRAETVLWSQTYFLHYVARLREAEGLTGFQADFDEDSDSGSAPSTSTVETIDLGRLSRKVGSDASNLGNFKLMLATLKSLREIVYADNGLLKWQTQYRDQSLQLYKRQTEEMIDIDSTFESTRQGLIEGLVEYQNRARNLQSVIFNLIAKEDANASIELAEESRAIAAAARNDGTSMKTVAIMTMVFLPATFYAALFAVPSLRWDESPVIQRRFWVYWAFTVPSTIIVLLTWYVVVSRQVAIDNTTPEMAEETRAWKNRSSDGIAGSMAGSIARSAQPMHPTNDIQRRSTSVIDPGDSQIRPRRPRTVLEDEISEFKEQREKSKQAVSYRRSRDDNDQHSMAYQMA